MGLDYFKHKKGIDLADTNVIFTVGDNAPYSHSGNQVSNGELTSAGIGSQFRNNTNGDVWKKTSTANGDVTDWILESSGTGSGVEDDYQNTFIGKSGTGSETPTYSSHFTTNHIADTNNLELAISTLDNEIGPDPTANTRSNNAITSGDNVNDNIEALDDAIGSDSDFTTPTYIAASNTLSKNLDILDDQVKTNSDSIQNLQQQFDLKENVKVITGDDISAFSGTSETFSDDNTGGVTLQVGDRILSTHPNSNDAVYVVAAGAWTTVSVDEGDAFYVSYDLPDDQHQERLSLYKYTGSTFEQIADFDFELADTISFSSYGPTNGNITGSDTVESAIEKLDGNQQDIQTTTGVSQGDTHLSTFTGTIIPDNQTIKAALQALEIDLDDIQTLTGVAAESTDLGTFTGTTITNNVTIKTALQELETYTEGVNTSLTNHLDGGSNKHDADEIDYERIDGSKKYIQTSSDDVEEALTDLDDALYKHRAESTQLAVTNTTVVLDSVPIATYRAAKWFVTAWDSGNTRAMGIEVWGIHNGTNADHTEYALIRAGGTITGVSLDVAINGANMELIVTVGAGTTIDVRSVRISVL